MDVESDISLKSEIEWDESTKWDDPAEIDEPAKPLNVNVNSLKFEQEKFYSTDCGQSFKVCSELASSEAIHNENSMRPPHKMLAEHGTTNSVNDLVALEGDPSCKEPSTTVKINRNINEGTLVEECSERSDMLLEKNFTCDECGKVYSRLSNLKRHLAIHTNEYALNCDVCGRGFLQKSALECHMVTHTGEKKFVCNICGLRYTRKSNLNTHVAKHSGRNFKCNICGKAFFQKSNLAVHVNRRHNEENDDVIKCPVCGRCFNHKAHLTSHMYKHTDNWNIQCSICGKSMLNESALEKHMQKHSDEKAFSCEFCGKNFARKESLNEHRTKHTGDRKHECDMCGHKFFTKSRLKFHLTKFHTGSHMCSVCSKCFTHESELNSHMGKHQRAKRFKCGICKKHFSCKVALRNHIEKLHDLLHEQGSTFLEMPSSDKPDVSRIADAKEQKSNSENAIVNHFRSPPADPLFMKSEIENSTIDRDDINDGHILDTLNSEQALHSNISDIKEEASSGNLKKKPV